MNLWIFRFFLLFILSVPAPTLDAHPLFFGLLETEEFPFTELKRELLKFFKIRFDENKQTSLKLAHQKLREQSPQKEKIYNAQGQTLLYRAVELENQQAVELLLALQFDVNECNSTVKVLPRHLSWNSEPVTLLHISESPRKRSPTSSLHFLYTPISASLQKPTARGLEIAKLLLDHGARLDIRAHEQKSLVETLLGTLSLHANADLSIDSPKVIFHNKVAGLIKELSENPDLREKMLPHWHVFANGISTAHFIGTNTISKELLNYFLPLLVEWKLDIELPLPGDALKIYRNIEHHLNENQKFIMLYDYLQRLYSLRNHEEFHHFKEIVLTRENLFDYSPSVIAKGIFNFNVHNFLKTPAPAFSAHCISGKNCTLINNFIAILEKLPGFVTYSIVSAKKPQEVANFWAKVADELGLLGDFHGLECVSLGISKVGSAIIAHEKISPKMQYLENQVVYERMKKARSDQGYIPALSKETSRLIMVSSVLNPHDYLDGESKYNIDKFQHELLDAQQRYGLVREAPKITIEKFLNSLDDSFRKKAEFLSEARNFKRLSLRAFSQYTEDWDSRALLSWMKSDSSKYTFGYFKSIAEMGIYDGPSLIEKYVFAISLPSKKLHPLFKRYQKYYGSNPLADIPKWRMFEDQLFLNADSSFHWIVWLRNNQLGQSIVPLFQNNVINFRYFIMQAHKNSQFNFVNAIAKEKLLSLFEIYNNSLSLPKLEQWNYKNVRAWLFVHGLEHLEPAIAKATKKRGSRFLAFLYFLKIDSRNAASQMPWLGHVMNDCLEKEYDIKAIAELYAEQPWHKRLMNNAFYFISVFKKLGLEKAYVEFFNQKIFSFGTLLKLSEDEIAEYALIEETAKLKSFIEQKTSPL